MSAGFEATSPSYPACDTAGTSLMYSIVGAVFTISLPSLTGLLTGRYVIWATETLRRKHESKIKASQLYQLDCLGVIANPFCYRCDPE